jgi:hypothetical protein
MDYKYSSLKAGDISMARANIDWIIEDLQRVSSQLAAHDRWMKSPHYTIQKEQALHGLVKTMDDLDNNLRDFNALPFTRCYFEDNNFPLKFTGASHDRH